MEAQPLRGDIPSVIRNDLKLYEGNLVHYFRALFFQAENVTRPYHNFRHMTHVAWLCYDACNFYRDTLDLMTRRSLMIAALFHDFDHSGMPGEDRYNIASAIEGLRKHAAPGDASRLPEIEELIRATEFPYKKEAKGLAAQILRDADLSQAFSVAWIQQVVFGLACEWKSTPLKVLEAQEGFLRALRFNTVWAKARFPQKEIDAKIKEGLELRELLALPAPANAA